VAVAAVWAVVPASAIPLWVSAVALALIVYVGVRFVSDVLTRRDVARACEERQFRVAIVGGGASSIAAAHYLSQRGIPYTVIERSGSLGGTWHENTYPGCACDVPSHLYSFSFAYNASWSQRWSSQSEILRYLESVIDAQHMRPHVLLNTEVLEARWSEADAQWDLLVRLTDSDSNSDADHQEQWLRFSAVISATGQLNKPKVPEFSGRESFEGAAFHSAQWRHEVELRDKNVVCIGTGASAIQLVPEVAKVAKHLTVVQRSPSWVMPKGNAAFSSVTQLVFRYVPLVLTLYRYWLYLSLDFNWIVMPKDSAASRFTERWLTKVLERSVADAALRKALLPDFPVGCKRLLITDDYLPALQLPNVRLVAGTLERILPNAVRVVPFNDGNGDGDASTSAVQIPADVIVYSTGFDTTHFCMPIRYYGREGLEIQQAFQDSPAAYLGITVPQFPNFFMLYGPNTNLGHSSIMYV